MYSYCIISILFIVVITISHINNHDQNKMNLIIKINKQAIDGGINDQDGVKNDIIIFGSILPEVTVNYTISATAGAAIQVITSCGSPTPDPTTASPTAATLNPTTPAPTVPAPLVCGSIVNGSYNNIPIRFEFTLLYNRTIVFSACNSMFDTELTLYDTDGTTVLASCDDCDANGKADTCGPCCTNGVFNIQSEITYELSPGTYFYELGSVETMTFAPFGIELQCITESPTMDPTTDPTIDPTTEPTTDPTKDPTADPTIDPTIDPTSDPTIDPTQILQLILPT